MRRLCSSCSPASWLWRASLARTLGQRGQLRTGQPGQGRPGQRARRTCSTVGSTRSPRWATPSILGGDLHPDPQQRLDHRDRPHPAWSPSTPPPSRSAPPSRRTPTATVEVVLPTGGRQVGLRRRLLHHDRRRRGARTSRRSTSPTVRWSPRSTPAPSTARSSTCGSSNNRLWVAGAFTHVASKAQRALATVNPTTGKFDPFMQAGHRRPAQRRHHHRHEDRHQRQGTRLIALGNFDTVDAAKHHQLFMLDLSGDRPRHGQLADRVLRDRLLEVVRQLHARPRLLPRRHASSWSRPPARTAGPGIACDSTARFETNAAGTGIKPSWINNTGGDTTYAVEITNSVVYTGGHARWQNNPFAADTRRPGRGLAPRHRRPRPDQRPAALVEPHP